MKVTFKYGLKGCSNHPQQSPWAKRTKKLIIPRFQFCKSRDAWTNFTSYHLWMYYRSGSSVIRIIV